MKKYLIFILLQILGLNVYANWQYSISNHNRLSYAAGSINYGIIQSDNGWMYFANDKGMLEYDGINWKLYPINNAKVRSIYRDMDGRIYAGGLRQFGYFIPSDMGRFNYVCLSDSLAKENVGNIYNIVRYEGYLYFQSDSLIYTYKHNKLDQIRRKGIVYSAFIDNTFYVVADRIYRLADQKLIPIINSDELIIDNNRKKIVGMHKYKDDLIVVTVRNGIFKYHLPTHSWNEYKCPESLKSYFLTSTALKNDILALGTTREGVLLLNLKDETLEHVSINNGLQDNAIMALKYDRDDNLWLALQNGIDCIHFDSPIYKNLVSKGSGFDSKIYNGRLYLGTSQGLFYSDYNEKSKKSIYPDILTVDEIGGKVNSLKVIDDELFCCGHEALWIVDHAKVSRVPDIKGAWSIHQYKDGKDLLLATYFGFYRLHKKNGQWEKACKLKGPVFSAKNMCYDSKSNTWWVSNKENGLFHMSINWETDSIVAFQNFNSSALPKGYEIYSALVDGYMVFTSRKGLYGYNNLKDSIEHNVSLEKMMDGHTGYSYVKQDENGNIWYVANGVLKILRKDRISNGYYKNNNDAFLKNCLFANFEHVNVLDKGKAIIGTEDGFSLLRYRESAISKKTPLNLLIRSVYIKGVKDSLVYGQNYRSKKLKLAIPYRNNSIRIMYSANNFDKSTPVLYSCSLKGPITEEWSNPTTNSIKEYIALPEGKYTFYVRTETEQDVKLVESLEFEILPPWYRSPISFIIYFLLIILFLLWVYRRINLSKKHLIMKKELEMMKQKEEFLETAKQKDQTIDLLKEEKLQSELKHKSEELVQTTLNIVRKNEILQELKKEAIGVSHSINEDNLPNLRRKMLRLISQIDTSIEHDNDLQTFQTAFDSVHHNFFNRLEKVCPELTIKEKMLCAYIHMNLLSKEIAPLMNISLRGVEVNRYRLRKKLGLEQKDSLTKFLQDLSNDAD